MGMEASPQMEALQMEEAIVAAEAEVSQAQMEAHQIE
jgi:hypothetical protein